MEVSNVKFVGEVEKHPELYNNTLQEYSRKEYTEKAWHEIAKEVNLSVAECKEKWRNLRSTFVKNIRPKPSGSAGGKKKPYYLTEAMQFAVPFIKGVGITSSNLPETPEEIPSHLTKPEGPITGDAQQDVIPSEDIFSESQKQTETQQPGSTPSQPSSPTPLQQGSRRDSLSSSEQDVWGGKRKLKSTLSDADKAFSEYFEAKRKLSNMFSEDDKREGIKYFLNSLIPDLMKMDDAQLRTYKRKTIDIIDDIMGTSPKLSYRPTSTSLHSPAEGNLSVMTNSSGRLYIKTDPYELSHEEM